MDLLQNITALCKRRGIIYPNSEIYGGIGGFFDYGPVGVEMKNNLKRYWWKYMVDSRENVVGIDGAIITHPKVWEASGHLTGFADEVVECKKCHQRFRPEDITDRCPKCGNKEFTDRVLNYIREKKGMEKYENKLSFQEYRDIELDKLEKVMRDNLEIEKIYRILNKEL